MSSRARRKVLALLAAVALAATAAVATAAVPEHAPGTICATPTFWCWSDVPGPVGAPCACLTAGGYVGGVYV